MGRWLTASRPPDEAWLPPQRQAINKLQFGFSGNHFVYCLGHFFLFQTKDRILILLKTNGSLEKLQNKKMHFVFCFHNLC